MNEKAYDDYKKQEFEFSKKMLKNLGLADDLKSIVQKSNMDLSMILYKIGLIKKINLNPSDISEILNYEYEEIMKMGIELGISSGKSMIIESCLNDTITEDEIRNIDTESLTKFEFNPVK